jgi:hypothetical protein
MGVRDRERRPGKGARDGSIPPGKTRERGHGMISRNPFIILVGTTGLEPAAPCTPCRCATRLRYVPICEK